MPPEGARIDSEALCFADVSRHIERSSTIVRTGRVLQLEGIFDVPPADRSTLSWDVRLPLSEKDWNIGLIVGPSGCGKTTIARELWPEHYVSAHSWRADRSVVDDFPADMSIKLVAQLLSSVGFSSPPGWLRPFEVLSTGEQFRASIARTLAEHREFAVVDEFSSVVDRTVAQIGSTAIAKTVRRRGGKFVAVTCHYDVEAWLDPDWVYDPSSGEFAWRVLRGRPAIELEICRVTHHAWPQFAPHHYLNANLNKAAVCFMAFYQGRAAAFDSWLAFVGRLARNSRGRRTHRTVCLPDFQGVGIGAALQETSAAMWKGLGYRAFLATSHPAFIAQRRESDHWRVTREAGRTALDSVKSQMSLRASRATNRLTSSFEYVGPAMPLDEAHALMESWAVQPKKSPDARSAGA